MHAARRRVLVVLFTGGVGTLLVTVAIPVLLGVRSLGLRTSAASPSAPATPTPPMQVEVGAQMSPVADERAGSLDEPATDRATPEPSILLDERFDNNDAGWPVRTDGTVWIRDTYHLSTQFASHFVAVRAPMVSATRNFIVTGVFRKVGGPDGGGYGLVARDRSTAPLDGYRQDGQYYVFEAGDRGLIGVWRRDDSTWIDLVPWSISAAVRTGLASNELTVRASGDHFQFEVNGVVVADVTDYVFGNGHVGLFVGGDGNQVDVDRLVVRDGE